MIKCRILSTGVAMTTTTALDLALSAALDHSDLVAYPCGLHRRENDDHRNDNDHGGGRADDNADLRSAAGQLGVAGRSASHKGLERLGVRTWVVLLFGHATTIA